MADDDCIATIADILPFRAECTPRATALQHLDGDGRLREATFAELHRDSEGLAGRLHEIGVRPRDRVAILLPNSRHWVTADYGVVRLGAVAVPLEQGMPCAGRRCRRGTGRCPDCGPRRARG
jgi:long-chain acyl-CoA synthetase